MNTQYATPTVGKQITVTTEWPDINLFATSPTLKHSLTGIVQLSPRWVPATSFMMLVDCPDVPVRVVPMHRVTDMVYADGSAASTAALPTENQTWSYTGSKGEKHTVTCNNSQYHCSCTGFSFRKTCKHIKESQNV